MGNCMRPQNQLLLFPELDPFKTIIKNIDYVDMSTLVDPKPNMARLNNYSEIPKDTFFIYKTGHNNPFRPDLGKIFPYIKNESTGKILKLNLKNFYVRTGVNVRQEFTVDIKMHRVVALAFIENENPEKLILVDHKNKDRLDYTVGNLRWVDHYQNSIGVLRPRNENWEQTLIKKGIV